MRFTEKQLLNHYSNGETDFSHSDLSNTYFDQLYLSGSDLSNCNLSQCQFLQCSFEQTDFTRANLSNTIFTECTLDGSDLSYSNISQSYLEGYFRNIDLEKANLSDSIILFDHDLLDGVNWDRVNLARTIFFGGFYHPKELLNECNNLDTSSIVWVSSKSDLDNLQLDNYNRIGLEKLRHILQESDE